MQRLVVQYQDMATTHNRYYLDGVRVSKAVYEERSAQCSSFDTFQTVTKGPRTRFYSVGRP